MPSLSCGIFNAWKKREPWEGTRAGGGRRERSEGPPPARGGAEAGPHAAPSPGLRDFCRTIKGRPIWPGFGAEAEDARAAGLKLAGRPRHLGGLPFVCVPCVDCLLARAARSRRALHLLAAVSRLPGGLGERARRLRRARRMTGVICIASTWVPLAVAWTFPVTFSGKAGRHLQPTMKSWQLIAVVGDALQVRRERKALNAGGDARIAGDQGELHGEEARCLPKASKPLTRGQGVEEGRGRGAGDRGRSVQIDIWAACGRGPPSAAVQRSRREVAACAPPRLPI